MQTIKNIENADLKENDVVRSFCNKCNTNTLFRVISINDNITGICSKCRGFKTLKKNENNITKTPIQNIPKCPTCSSTNIKKVSGTSKAVSVAMFGLLSQKVKKQFQCNNCGYEW